MVCWQNDEKELTVELAGGVQEKCAAGPVDAPGWDFDVLAELAAEHGGFLTARFHEFSAAADLDGVELAAEQEIMPDRATGALGELCIGCDGATGGVFSHHQRISHRVGFRHEPRVGDEDDQLEEEAESHWYPAAARTLKGLCYWGAGAAGDQVGDQGSLQVWGPGAQPGRAGQGVPPSGGLRPSSGCGAGGARSKSTAARRPQVKASSCEWPPG